MKRPRIRRVLLGIALGGTASVMALWIAVNRVEWLGPIVADGLRAVIGVDNVAHLEDTAYAVQDRVNLLWRSGEKPQAYWAVPEEAAPPAPSPVGSATAPDDAAPTEPALAPFAPPKVGPVHESWSAPGDGVWVKMADPAHPDAPVSMYKTLLHPDKSRSWAELFVVAIDLRRVRLHLVAGNREPKATEPEALELERPGTIPEEAHSRVLAAFNGGFKTEHGGYGMKLGETTLVKPRDGVCAVVRYKDDSVDVNNWTRLAAREDEMVFWRQTPNCMFEDGKMHARLKEGFEKKWGATLDGETVIRRSAIGVNADRTTLFVGISNHTTAPAIATGMNHAGALNVAQLDVNFSYPKFVTFEKKPEGDARIAIPLASGFEFSEDEFIREKARRDFFYLMPAEHEARTATAP